MVLGGRTLYSFKGYGKSNYCRNKIPLPWSPLHDDLVAERTRMRGCPASLHLRRYKPPKPPCVLLLQCPGGYRCRHPTGVRRWLHQPVPGPMHDVKVDGRVRLRSLRHSGCRHVLRYTLDHEQWRSGLHQCDPRVRGVGANGRCAVQM